MRKKNMPTSVRGAIRRGWHPVTISTEQRRQHNVAHMGLHIFCQFNIPGLFKSTFDPVKNESKFAFENEQDAFFFSLRWS